MTIKRKRVNAGALVEVEADNTDTVDTNGFSDAIQSVGAETAQFSDTSTMQANTGLRIGLTQLKINTSTAIVPNGTTIPTTNVTNPSNIVDGNIATFSGPDSIGTGITAVTVDVGSIITAHINIVFDASTTTFANNRVEYSTDNSIWNTAIQVATQTTSQQNNTSVEFTFRYMRIIVATSGGNSFRYYLLTPVAGTSSDVNVNIRSSATIDTADGTILGSTTMLQNTTTVFDSELLLTGNGQYITVQIISFGGLVIPVSLSEITSILEVS